MSVYKVQSGFIYFYCDKKLFGGLLLKKKKSIFHLSFFKLCTKWFAVWVCLAFVGRYWYMLLYFLASQFDDIFPKPSTTDFKWLEKTSCLLGDTQILYHHQFKYIPFINIPQHEWVSAMKEICYFHLNELMSLGEEEVDFFF